MKQKTLETIIIIKDFEFSVDVVFDHTEGQEESRTDPKITEFVDITAINLCGIGLNLMAPRYSHLITTTIREELEDACIDWVVDEKLAYAEDFVDYKQNL